jgi:hypothetical protein
LERLGYDVEQDLDLVVDLLRANRKSDQACRRRQWLVGWSPHDTMPFLAEAFEGDANNSADGASQFGTAVLPSSPSRSPRSGRIAGTRRGARRKQSGGDRLAEFEDALVSLWVFGKGEAPFLFFTPCSQYTNDGMLLANVDAVIVGKRLHELSRCTSQQHAANFRRTKASNDFNSTPHPG